MKRTTIILFSVLLTLALFYFFKPEGSLGGQLRWKAVKPEATQVTTVFHNKTNSFILKDGKWLTQPEGYLADKEKVVKMVNALSTNRTFTLISTYPIYEKYELTPASKVTASLTQPSGVRTLEIGKTSSTYSHSFVLMAGDSNIYQTEGYLAPDFNQELEQYRDRNIFSFKLEEVVSVDLKNASGATMSISKGNEAFSTNTNASASKTFWKDSSGTRLKESEVNDLVSIISHLSASGFPAENKDFSVVSKLPVSYQVTIKTAGKSYTLSLLSVKEKDKTDVLAISSERNESFLVYEDSAKRISLSFDKLKN